MSAHKGNPFAGALMHEDFTKIIVGVIRHTMKDLPLLERVKRCLEIIEISSIKPEHQEVWGMFFMKACFEAESRGKPTEK
jgi:hypothetical protein